MSDGANALRAIQEKHLNYPPVRPVNSGNVSERIPES